MSIRELRNRGGEVVARVQGGEPLTVTHAGLPVARIVPIAPPAMSAEALVAAWRHLPRVDLDELRRDIDELLDPRLHLDSEPPARVTIVPTRVSARAAASSATRNVMRSFQPAFSTIIAMSWR